MSYKILLDRLTCDDEAEEFLDHLSEFEEGTESGHEIHALIDAAKNLSHFVGRDDGVGGNDTTGGMCLKLTEQALSHIIFLLSDTEDYLIEDNLPLVAYLKEFDPSLLPQATYDYADQFVGGKVEEEAEIQRFQERLSQAIRSRDEVALKLVVKDAKKYIQEAANG